MPIFRNEEEERRVGRERKIAGRVMLQRIESKEK